ncbi:AGE family epimerase/isomerase [Achromobacter aloeverae]|uniref:N-acylglucosamine 2-epimerase n=1 Tax=Achromobacter aloeverae TaxID=1750518 RepID=A0A4Q1HP26_9BURK|nr:AGE family epimerase/isomerase [Achromobacter aloeverae]RXN92758.1 N-acylglucosamine 2-epimerase [Achromobacter aloeverae]
MPAFPSDPVDSSLLALVADLRRHYSDIVLPLWRTTGYNPDLQLPYEAVDGARLQVLPVARYRTMACARQLYVHTTAGAAGHAARLFDALRTRFVHPEGGWVYSVDAQGAPLDLTHDLYTYAFVIFACAAHHGATRDRRALDLLAATAGQVEARFAAPAGLYWAQLKPDWSGPLQDVQQNPVMHLTEAYLAARDATGDAAYTTALQRIVAGMAGAFLHAPTQCITELRVGAPENRIEPGHQFEWLALSRSAPDVFDDTLLGEALERAFTFAQSRGVDMATDGVCAALGLDGGIIDATQRIWAQTEYARALAVHGDPALMAVLKRQLRRLRERFLQPRGWYECLRADGRVARTDMPSTTPYHLATSYAALPSA